MCEFLKELFADEIKAAEVKAEEKGKVLARFEDGMTIEAIAEKSRMGVKDVKEILKEKGKSKTKLVMIKG